MRGEHGLVLAVGDDDEMLGSVCDVLEENGFDCWLARSARDAAQRLWRERRTPDVVLLDVEPGVPIGEFVSFLRNRAAPLLTRVVLMTAAGGGETPQGVDVDAVLVKPFAVDAVPRTITRVLAERASGSPGERP